MLAASGMMAARDAAGATVPTAPSDLAVEQTSDTSTRVTWTDNSNNEDQYNVYRQKDGGGFSKVATKSTDAESHDDTGLTTGSTYDYKVSAENEVGESTQIGPVTITVEADVPDAPTNLSATAAADDQVDLTWTDNATNEDEYRIYRDSSLFDTIAANSTSYSATGLAEGTEYDWQVAAANSSGEAKSSTVTQATKLGQPTGILATTNDDSEFGFTSLTWVDTSDHEQNYEVFKSGGLFDTIPADSTSYDITCPDATGTWKVRAIHSTLPDSDFSSTVSGSTCSE